MPVPVWWKGLQTAFQLVGRVFRVLRKVPYVDDLIDRTQRTLLNPVVVKLIRDADDPDLDAALDLYKKRIPDDQRFEADDIVRWLREDRDNRKHHLNGPFDWFIVAKVRRRVCGFILFHYYPLARLAFFAYMVVSNTPGTSLPVSRSLSAQVSHLLSKKKELRGYQGFVLEVEDPRKEKDRRKQDECLARVRRFCTLAEMQGVSLRAFDFDYKQPRLSLDDPDNVERPLLLLSARKRGTTGVTEETRSELKDVLEFIYTRVYPEGYSADAAENRAYQEYCAELLKKELAALPATVRSLSPSQLASQVGRKPVRAKSASLKS